MLRVSARERSVERARADSKSNSLTERRIGRHSEPGDRWLGAPSVPRESGSMAAEPGDATDEMLMIRYQRGNGPAFAELVHRHSRPVYNFVLRQLRDGGVAEDVTEEVFLRVVRNAAAFKHEARFSTWLYSIATHLCLDRRGRPTNSQPASWDDPATRTDAEGVGVLPAERQPQANSERPRTGTPVLRSILQTVDSLPDDQREVFLMREVANLAFSQIAEITRSSETTVKSRMRYALERLREALAHFDEYARALR